MCCAVSCLTPPRLWPLFVHFSPWRRFGRVHAQQNIRVLLATASGASADGSLSRGHILSVYFARAQSFTFARLTTTGAGCSAWSLLRGRRWCSMARLAIFFSQTLCPSTLPEVLGCFTRPRPCICALHKLSPLSARERTHIHTSLQAHPGSTRQSAI
jgi:hypothetical protein